MNSIIRSTSKINPKGALPVKNAECPFDEMGFDRIDFTLNLGNCLFDNIIAQLPGSKSSAALRQEMVQFMKAHAEKYQDLLDYGKENKILWGEGDPKEAFCFTSWIEYLHIMAQDLVWTGDIEIHALSELLNRPMVIMEIGQPAKLYNPASTGQPLFLEHINLNHFVSRIPKQGLDHSEAYAKIMAYKHPT